MNLVKKIEAFANLAILAIAIFLGAVLIKRYPVAPTGESPSEPDQRITVGARISLPGVNWANDRQTLLLFLSEGCPYCSDSAPFYRRLVDRASGSIRLIAILPEAVEEGRRYLNELGVSVDEVKQPSLASVGITAVPTLVLVDGAGIVRNIWSGKLTNDRESEVLSSLAVDDHKQGEREAAKEYIEPRELKRALNSKHPPIVVQVDDRAEYAKGHIPGAKNIPLDELEVRAANELSPSDLIVLYCNCAKDEKSKAARQILIDNGFTRVLVLRGGFEAWQKLPKAQ
jgi:rhodanese-related sulfurtransferase/thioredoxin-related protein